MEKRLCRPRMHKRSERELQEDKSNIGLGGKKKSANNVAKRDQKGVREGGGGAEAKSLKTLPQSKIHFFH